MNTISRTVRVATAAGLALALVLLAACASPADSSGDGKEPAKSNAPATPPTVSLTAPTAGETLPAGTITAAVETTGLKFVMPNNEPVAGEGHVHFTLDDRPEVMSVEKSAEIADVEPGPHTLTAELVQNDTSPFDPPVKVEIEFVAE